jgi:DNA polymerase III alpha subunit
LCNGAAVAWHSKKQTAVSTSSSEAEFVSASKAADEIVKERDNGEYTSFQNFLSRMKGKRVVNKKVIENLIFSNAFDEEQKDCYEQYCSIKGESNTLRWTKKDLLNREREAINCNISYSSIDKQDIINTISIDSIEDGNFGQCAFTVVSKKSAKTKKAGKPYKILSVIDLNNGNKCSIFLWDISVNFEDGLSYKAKIKKNGDFYSWTI